MNAIILATAVAVAALATLFLYPLEVRRYESHFRRIHLLLDTTFQQKRDDLANELFARKERALAASLRDLAEVEGVAGAVVYLPDGAVFVASEGAPTEALSPAERSAAEGLGTFVRLGGREAHLGVYTRAIEVIGRKIGYLRLYYDFSALEKETLLSVAVFLVLLLAAVAVVSGLITVLLSRLVVRPVSLLRTAIREVEAGHLGRTVNLPYRDEIGEVGNAFNEMSLELGRSQVALREAEEKYRGIFENANEGLFQCTRGAGRFLTVNPSMARILGYGSAEELLSQVTDLGNQVFADARDWERLEGALREDGRVTGVEVQVRKRDGEVVWIALSARSVADDSGAVSHYEGSFADVTERKERARAEREREAAEAANRAKSDFLAHMSHEIRTPMNAILGFADLLSPTMGDPQQRGYLESIRSSGRSLLSLINDILDLSKIEAGRMELQYEPTDLRSLLDEVSRIFAAVAEQKGLSLEVEVAEEVPGVLVLDAVRLRQVLFNLLGNAVKFTERGSVRLCVGKVGDNPAGGLDLAFAVRDTGVGIRPDSRSEIFEAFGQQSGQRSEVYGGTGLGLTISKKLVEMMGGEIRVDSRPGEGSAFEVRLPGVRPAPGSPPQPASRPGPGEMPQPEGTLLVVDDIESNRDLVRAFLRGTRTTVIEAEDGPQAVELCREHRPDAVLMDIRMPGMDGHTAAAHIRGNPSTSGIPIIAMTASGMKEDVERIQRSGFDGYLIRPCTRFELRRELVRVLERRGRRGDPGAGGGEGEPAWATLSDAARAGLAEVVDQLEKDLLPQWEAVRQKQRIPDIEAFARRAASLGEDREVPPLSAFGAELLRHVASFDVDSIQRCLVSFPPLVERLGRLLRE